MLLNKEKPPVRVVLVELVLWFKCCAGGFVRITGTLIAYFYRSCATFVAHCMINTVSGVTKDSGYDFLVHVLFHFSFSFH